VLERTRRRSPRPRALLPRTLCRFWDLDQEAVARHFYEGAHARWSASVLFKHLGRAARDDATDRG